MNDPDAVAVIGGRVFAGLVDLTSDISALDGNGTWIVVAPFAGSPVCARFEVLRAAIPSPAPAWKGPLRSSWRSSLDRGNFEEGVRVIRDLITTGDVYQVNLCRVISAPFPDGGDIAELGDLLAAGNPAPYSAMVRIPCAGLFVASASPERFLMRRGRVVESRPIKGTAATADGFLEKDFAENVMIVDLVRNDLGRVCEYGSVRVPALCAPEQHPGLFHMVSTVEGLLRADYGWPELIGATFPPGSVTGAPKIAALEVISKLEPVEREVYCGAIGWVDADRGLGDLNVAIRTFWAGDGLLHLGTGGGITCESTPAGEWEETELKARKLLAVASS